MQYLRELIKGVKYRFEEIYKEEIEVEIECIEFVFGTNQ